MLVKIASKDSEVVANALIKHACKLPQELYKSLTWDRGTEMASHRRFTGATDIAVYFCDPQHPWQRGSNENRPVHCKRRRRGRRMLRRQDRYNTDRRDRRSREKQLMRLQ